jgi:hypothetical protein
MSDSDVFGVQRPESGEVGYGCVLGAFGEVYGLIVYLGSEGLEQYRQIRSGKRRAGSPEHAYDQTCLAAWFGSRRDLDAVDLGVVKELGFNFRGSNAWPQFRSMKPAYFPWYLAEGEANFLRMCLEQAVEVALRLNSNPDWLSAPGKNHYLVRVPIARDGGWLWESRWLKPAPPAKLQVRPYPVDEVRLQRIKQAAEKRDGIWEADWFYLPAPVDEGDRPYFPYSMFCADHESGFLFGSALAEPSEWEIKFPPCLLECIETHRVLPSALWVRKEELRDLLEPMTSRLNIELKLAKKLPAIDRAKNSMFKYFKSRG